MGVAGDLYYPVWRLSTTGSPGADHQNRIAAFCLLTSKALKELASWVALGGSGLSSDNDGVVISLLMAWSSCSCLASFGGRAGQGLRVPNPLFSLAFYSLPSSLKLGTRGLFSLRWAIGDK